MPEASVVVEVSPHKLVRVMVTPGSATPDGPDAVHWPLLPITLKIGHGVGVGQVQLPLTSKTMCMFGKPMAAVVVGVVSPQAGALK